MFRLLLPSVLLLGLAISPAAVASPEAYRCEVQSSFGYTTSLMVGVDRIIIDEAARSVRFLSGNTDFGMPPIDGDDAIFDMSADGFTAGSINFRLHVFAFDRKTGMATHSWVEPKGMVATTWKCALLEPQPTD